MRRGQPGEEEAIENLAGCIIRDSFSQERMTYIPKESKVLYRFKDEKKVYHIMHPLYPRHTMRDHLYSGSKKGSSYHLKPITSPLGKEGRAMGDKKVKDIMGQISEYETVDVDDHLCDALSILKRNHENIKSCGTGSFHKTVFVTDSSKKIIGMISMYDLIRGLVPESARKPELSRAFYSILSSRAIKVSEEVGEVQERFAWLGSSFLELVKQEAHKKVKDIMTPVFPLLSEEDAINKAIFVMFKENTRQPLVTREGEIVGVVDLMSVLDELLEIAGPECYVNWEG